MATSSSLAFAVATVLSLALSCYGQDCPFFGPSRVASPKTNLVNCTWYEANSCCERAEVTAVFQEMLSLQGASQACRNRVNYMMCYFCAPNQRSFMRGIQRQAAMCSSYCDDTFNQCSGARHNGISLGSRYSNGQQFCEANFFIYEANSVNCLAFDASAFSAAPIVHARHSLVLPVATISAIFGFLQLL